VIDDKPRLLFPFQASASTAWSFRFEAQTCRAVHLGSHSTGKWLWQIIK
jgi:hypothetical protein